MITTKPLNSERNLFAPRADRLSIAYAIDEGDGSRLLNLGLGYPTTIPVGSTSFSLFLGISHLGTAQLGTTRIEDFDGVIFEGLSIGGSDGDTISTVRWFSGDEGQFLYLASDVVTGGSAWYVQVFKNMTTDACIFLRGTIFIRFKLQNLLNEDQIIFNTGGPSTTPNRLHVFRDGSSGRITIHFNDSNTTSAGLQWRFNFDTQITNTKIYSLAITWGEKGFNAWLDGVEAKLLQIPGPIYIGNELFVDTRPDALTMDFWVVHAGDSIRIGRDGSNNFGDVSLWSISIWDVQLCNVELAEIFADAYLPFRPRAKDYGSGPIDIFRTNVNPIPVRPRLNKNSSSHNKDEITFSVVTDKNLLGVVYLRICYDTDPFMANPIISTSVSSDLQDYQLNLTIGGLHHATTYYYIAQYSVDGTDWSYFPGGRGKFRTQRRDTQDFDFAFWADDHIGEHSQGGPPLDTLSLYPGYGADILRYIVAHNIDGRKWFLAWRSMYDIYVNQDVDFIIIGGDYYYPDNYIIYAPDTDALDNPHRLAATWRNWCNLLYKCGVCYYVQGNHENEAGYLQKDTVSGHLAQIRSTQMHATIARKKFFPGPTYSTYDEGGENENPFNNELDWIPESGNNWIPPLGGDYNQDYRNTHVIGIDQNDPNILIDSYRLNRSPLENYFAWSWGDSLFVVLDMFRYTDVGDPQTTNSSTYRPGPNWTLGEAQLNWLKVTLDNSNHAFKFVCLHHLPGEAILQNGEYSTNGQWYGRGSGSNILHQTGVNNVNPYPIVGESNEEIELHRLFKKYSVTAVIKGHDHKFCYVVNDEVTYITATCAGAPNQFETDGTRNSYGNTEDQNQQKDIAKERGIKCTSNTRGYCLFTFRQHEWNVINRLTAFSPFDEDSLQNQDYANIQLGGRSQSKAGPGWAGPVYSPDQLGQITLSETPWDVYTICLVDDAVFMSPLNEANIWSELSGVNPSINLYTNNEWEEFHQNNILQIESSSNTPTVDVRVSHAPADVYTSNILNAIDDRAPTVLHNIESNNVIFIYNINVPGSYEVAQYYRQKRSIPTANLVGLDIPVPSIPLSCEQPITKLEFETAILFPLRIILSLSGDSSATSSGNLSSTAIVLGFGTPLSYREDDGEIIAIASRLHRLHYDYEPKLRNYTFDRRVFKFFDQLDAKQLYITSVLDGPSVAAVKKLIDRSLEVDNQIFINGKLIIDPYGLRDSSEDVEYEDNILNFAIKPAKKLGLPIVTTVRNNSSDPYDEPLVGYFQGESFYWGWFEPSFSPNLFFSQSQSRVFLYNADNSAACQIHYLIDNSPFNDQGSDPWCNIAINIEPGYASCAGSVDSPGTDAFLRPRPFFDALHHGACLGEAFLFASPFVNWKTILIGDPLMTVNFPNPTITNIDPFIHNDDTIRSVKLMIEQSLAWGARQARLTEEIVEFNVRSNNLAEEINLLYGLSKWKSRKEIQTHYNLLSQSVQRFMSYILTTTILTFDQWLAETNEKTSMLLSSLVEQLGFNSIPAELLYPRGHWDVIFTYIHLPQTFENVHFQLQVSTDKDFTNIVVNVNSAQDINGWKYESEQSIFTQLSNSGLPSSFSGRRLKFVSTKSLYLRYTEIFYVRWIALKADGITVLNNYTMLDKPIIIER